MSDNKDELVPTTQDYKNALIVQDACNLLGVVSSFSKVLIRVRNEVQDTELVWKHPISVLYSGKISSLTNSERTEEFSKAYDICKKRS